MYDLIQITAEYSNAVLVAIMPHLSDFAQKLNLPMQTPITPAQVLHFRCDPRKGHIGGSVTLTNLSEFAFLNGCVSLYRSPSSYYSLQDPARTPDLYGKTSLQQPAALAIARGVASKLGYEESLFHLQTPPKVTLPIKTGGHEVPRFLFQWLDPDWKGSVVAGDLTVEVNSSNGQIEMVTLSPTLGKRPEPKVDVQPPPANPRPQTPGPHTGEAKPLIPTTKAFSDAFLAAIMPQVSDFIVRAGLRVPTPLTTNQVDMSIPACWIDNGRPGSQFYLTNGDRFNYQGGHIVAFYARDVFFQVQAVGRVEDHLGKKNMSTNDAVALAKRTLESLGYAGKPARIAVGGPVFIGNDDFTRYFVHFHRPEDNSWIAAFEIDLADKGIKSIYFDDPSLYRDPPKVDVPLEPGVQEEPPPIPPAAPGQPPPSTFPPGPPRSTR
jgi:hypothetical protein